MIYANQQIDFEITIVEKNQKKIIKSPRCSVNYITFGGSKSQQASITIWGINHADLDALTYYGTLRPQKKFNTIIVRVNGEIWYSGYIITATTDYNQAPDIPLTMSCHPCPYLNTEIIQPFTFDGEISLFDIVSALAAPYDITVTNVDTDYMINSPNLKGSVYSQIYQAVSMVGAFVEFGHSEIVLSKKNVARQDIPSIEISPKNGLFGYPMYQESGLAIKTVFNPAYQLNQNIKLISTLPLASGSYMIGAISHDLSCMLPGGRFESNLLIWRLNAKQD